MKKVGVALPEDLLKKIDEPLEYGDSRSERIRRLVELGLMADSHLKANGMYSDRMPENNAVLRDALRDFRDDD